MGLNKDRKRGQVPPDIRNVIGVLPLSLGNYRDGEDTERVKILLSSLHHFDKDRVISALVIIVDNLDKKRIEELKKEAQDLPIKVVHEYDVLPALSKAPTLSGWVKQQILKIAASKIVATDFYLTLDADVICCKPLNYHLLINDGKAVMQMDGKVGMASLFNRASWWFTSAAILKTSPRFLEPGVAVTPFLMSRQVCLDMIAHLCELYGVQEQSWIWPLLCRNLKRNEIDTDFWHITPSSLGWTEYSLYHLFLTKMDIFEKYHYYHEQGRITYIELLSRNSFGFMFSEPRFSNWSVKTCFSSDDAALFFAVQSRSLIPTSLLRKKLSGYFCL